MMIALADHFEPAIMSESEGGLASPEEQQRRMDEWCRTYPRLFDRWRDADGFPLRHTYFYPAEQIVRSQVEQLAEHCRDGWGEIEIHLHHGVESPDTAENTRRLLVQFKDMLVELGCLSRWEGQSDPRYAFVHGNWALANSAGGRFCGVDEEMQILSETGCYGDFTLPSAPDPSQITKINALYECGLPLNERAPHRRGRNLRRGTAPQTFPLIVQGPLGLNFENGIKSPKIENGALTTAYPPTLERLKLWREAGVVVEGQPDWLFIKLHCHGMNPDDHEVMIGSQITRFLQELTEWVEIDGECSFHFVTAREMVNIILAACDGKEGNPGDFRDYRLRLVG